MGLLTATLLGSFLAAPVPGTAPGTAPAALPAPPAAVSLARPAPVRVRLPESAVEAALSVALERRGHLDRFQVGPSKFRDGRVRLDSLELAPGSAPGRARFVAHGSLDYSRRRLSIRWRGLKTRRQWKDTGRKDVARVRLTGEVRLAPARGGTAPALIASALRVKIVSRLSPLRGVVARFDLEPRRFPIPDVEILGLHLSDVRLEGATTSALLVSISRG